MKLTAKVKLQPTSEQHQILQNTLEVANSACRHISELAWAMKVYNQFKLQKLVYQDVRESFSLSAQMTVRCISKVADAYKLDKKTLRTFALHGAIAYDDRILSWKTDKQEVSIWTTEGRIRIPFVCGSRQLELLKNQRGESDLALVNGNFYLFATCEVEIPDPQDVEDILGVDLGIINIATDSDGHQYSGSQVLGLRKRRRRQRQRLQKKGTKSAKRVLKRLAGRESRFSGNVNHLISKQIVERAKGTNRAIALEELKGIRQRIRFRKPQRVNLHSWAFAQLGEFIKYKAQQVGIPVIMVYPKYTSQICSSCGYVDKRNRKNQAHFSCVLCGHTLHADHNAALNIAMKGWPEVNPAYGSTLLS